MVEVRLSSEEKEELKQMLQTYEGGREALLKVLQATKNDALARLESYHVRSEGQNRLLELKCQYDGIKAAITSIEGYFQQIKE